jgi:hypothetical protein
LNKAKENPSLLQRGVSVRKIENKMSFFEFFIVVMENIFTA